MLNLPPVAEPPVYNTNDLYYWNHVALELNRMTHSLTGPQMGPTMSSRALGILHLAMHDAWFGLRPTAAKAGGFSTYLDAGQAPPHPLPLPPAGGDAGAAMAAAAITVLDALYGHAAGPGVSDRTAALLADRIAQATRDFGPLPTRSPSCAFGVAVAKAILQLLAVKPNEPGAGAGNYTPPGGRYGFGDDPSHPVRVAALDPNDPNSAQKRVAPWHGPYYGSTAKRMATQTADHLLADPPRAMTAGADDEYNDAVRDVVAMGGAPGLRSTLRTPDQTTAALFWAYDGANLIGTPPRLYNQILRQLAWDRKDAGDVADPAVTDGFVRLFALVNAAMADAGVFSWAEKYHHQFWRPLTGVREHDAGSGAASAGQTGSAALAASADPFWQALGAPETNTHKLSFKPPFPAYPSGHATFGAAAFQMMRLYYKQRDKLAFDDDKADCIGFDFVSEELNGVSRDLYESYRPEQPITEQPGIVRTRVVRHFPSLWAAMFENAMSRIWLGVHWRFDAFAAQDVLQGKAAPYDNDAAGRTLYKPAETITYCATGTRGGSGAFPVGGVPLGLGIANEIFCSRLRPTPEAYQPRAAGVAADTTKAATTVKAATAADKAATARHATVPPAAASAMKSSHTDIR